MKVIKGHLYKRLMYVVDLVMINVAFIVALLLGFDGNIPQEYKTLYIKSAAGLTIVLFGTFCALKVYKNLWHYISFREMSLLVMACYIGDGLFVVLGLISKSMFPGSIYFIYPLVLAAILGGIRSSYRIYKKLDSMRRREKATKRVMLVGAGEAATFIIKDFEVNENVTERIVLCVDDNLEKQGLTLNGIPIKGRISDVPQLAEEYKIEEIIIAIPSATSTRKKEIIKICNSTKCKVKIFPGIEALLNEPQKLSKIIRDVQPIDLLGREEIQFNNKKLRQILKGRTIMVTGGGGSIGSELCRQIVSFKPRLLVILDIYENNAYDLQMELLQNGIPRDIIRVVIASVRDKKRIDEIFNTYKPNIVFHAAAHKHVPLMEDNPEEAIKNNVFGTLNVAQCAVAHNVSKFVLVSTDKAVNPTNVMGATKRLCEMIIQAINETTSTTDFVAVRFGNVLGSNGSVIPLFKRQLAAGGPITVTHPDIIRYFMTIPEAVRLILEATSFATGGEIFVLDMGQPVKILDLAKNFIRLSGLELDKDIKIKFTGLRPGEKLYEELLMAEEGLTKTSSDKIFVGKAGEIDFGQLSSYLDELRKVLANKEDVRKALKDIVPTYRQLEYDNASAVSK